MNATITFVARHTRVMRMTGELHFVFFSNRDNPLQKVTDPFPISICINRASLRQRRLLFGFVVDERTVHGAASASSRLGADNSQDAQVVFQSREAGAGRVANHLADIVDLPISLGTLAEHEIGILRIRNVVRTKRSGTISSLMPNDSTRSFNFVKPSTDHCWSNCSDGRALQMLFTPNAASNFRISSEDSCWWPTFIRAFRGALTLLSARPEAFSGGENGSVRLPQRRRWRSQKQDEQISVDPIAANPFYNLLEPPLGTRVRSQVGKGPRERRPRPA